MSHRTEPTPASVLGEDRPRSECIGCGAPTPDLCMCERLCAHAAPDDWDDGSYEDRCETCGGDGTVEYNEVAHRIEPEGFPVLENHLIECPDCGGAG